ncbi:MAG: hypothetical protein R3E87_12255 [Burkholderiaceae bacterium]
MLARSSIVPRVVQPTMTHQFMLRFDTDACRDARQRLADCRLEGQPLFDIGPELAPDCLHFGNGLWREVDPNAMISDPRNMRSHRFGDLFYQMEAIKSGCHHPDGLLWLRTERPIAAGEGKVSILDILPTVLSLLDVPVPAQLDGRSLVHDAAMPLAA